MLMTGRARTVVTRVTMAVVTALALLVPLSLVEQTPAVAAPAPAADTCSPGTDCVELGEPSGHGLTTINNGGLRCTVTWSVDWGDGSAPTQVTLLPGAQQLVWHMYPAVGTYTETDTPTIAPSSDPDCFNVPGGWYEQRTHQVVNGLTARIAPVAPVLRAGHAFLDASASTGPRQIDTYTWDFAPEGDCPSNLSLANPSVTSSSPTLDIVVLCDLSVRLTVSDVRGRTAQQSAHVSVSPRTAGQWKPTTVDLVPEGSSADPRTPAEDFALPKREFRFALTASRCRRDTRPLLLCPPTDGLGTLEGKAYNLADVNDSNGPFHGFWFVVHNNVTVKMTGLFNPNLFKSSATKHPAPDHRGKKVNWFTLNQRRGKPVSALTKAVRAHEGWGRSGSAARPNNSGHAGATACYLREDKTRHNPAVALEMGFDRQKANLVSHTNDNLRRISGELRSAAADPLPLIWTGTTLFWNSTRHRWQPSVHNVGAAGRTPTC
ncbi:hypothetical protein ABZY90_00340 [Streptomyces sp. NPDC006422]|uniref:hypothetical protein n=1 Tax=unclassified Streptomyces TaxID=2593676 RepID=UPI0033A50C80